MAKTSGDTKMLYAPLWLGSPHAVITLWRLGSADKGAIWPTPKQNQTTLLNTRVFSDALSLQITICFHGAISNYDNRNVVGVGNAAFEVQLLLDTSCTLAQFLQYTEILDSVSAYW